MITVAEADAAAGAALLQGRRGNQFTNALGLCGVCVSPEPELPVEAGTGERFWRIDIESTHLVPGNAGGETGPGTAGDRLATARCPVALAESVAGEGAAGLVQGAGVLALGSIRPLTILTSRGAIETITIPQVHGPGRAFDGQKDLLHVFDPVAADPQKGDWLMALGFVTLEGTVAAEPTREEHSDRTVLQLVLQIAPDAAAGSLLNRCTVYLQSPAFVAPAVADDVVAGARLRIYGCAISRRALAVSPSGDDVVEIIVLRSDDDRLTGSAEVVGVSRPAARPAGAQDNSTSAGPPTPGGKTAGHTPPPGAARETPQ